MNVVPAPNRYETPQAISHPSISRSYKAED
jgi:hypothetical protein